MFKLRDFFRPKPERLNQIGNAPVWADRQVVTPKDVGEIPRDLLLDDDGPKVHTVRAAGGKIDPKVAEVSELRRRVTPHSAPEARSEKPKRGMWVRYSRSTGILTNLAPGDIATVMLVDRDGFNMVEVTVLAKELRQATFDEIPEARRPDYETALRIGYTRET